VDALSTAPTHQTESSQSLRLLAIQNFHEGLAGFKKFKHTSITQHLYGEINYMADRISRDKMQEFKAACEQMGLRPRKIPTDAAFIQQVHSIILHKRDNG
jgi:hypothetical protein